MRSVEEWLVKGGDNMKKKATIEMSVTRREVVAKALRKIHGDNKLEMVTPPGRAGRYCRFGWDHGTEFCVSAGTGEVVSLSVNSQCPDRFVNTAQLHLDVLYQVKRGIWWSATALMRDQSPTSQAMLITTGWQG